MTASARLPILLLSLGMGLLLAVTAASAQTAAPVWAGKTWGALSAAQRDTLAPLAEQWGQMDAASRDTWALIATRYAQLPAAEQQRLRERMKDWAQLSPAERQRVHQGYQAAQRLSAAERQAKWERYQALSPERRQALQERAVARRSAASAPASAPRPAGKEGLDAQTLLPRRAP